MITFDDGYRDCYSVVYPELKRRGLPAVFFITVDFVNDRRVGWWDLIAYLVKQAALESPRRIAHQDESFLLPQEQTRCIRFFQREMKKAPQEQAVRLLEELSTLCGVPLPSRERQDEQIMTWDQIIEMSKNGMGIGSHTMSHRVLASLSAEEQTWELRESRQRIESILGQDVFAISYPVGGTDHLTPQTFRLAKESGYDLAFVFDFRSTRAKNCDPHAISRLYPVSDPQKFAAMVKFPRVMAYKQKSIVYPAVPSESPKPSN
jgi:peptidoglycan/xylan/chitin deacetylase (PgdA/CDA1 family)